MAVITTVTTLTGAERKAQGGTYDIFNLAAGRREHDARNGAPRLLFSLAYSPARETTGTQQYVPQKMLKLADDCKNKSTVRT